MEFTSRLLINFLLNAAWQITLIALAGFACVQLLRPAPARLRYAVLVAALVLSVFLPALTTLTANTGVLDLTGRSLPVEAVTVSPVPYLGTADLPVDSAAESGLTISIGRTAALGILAVYLAFVLYRAVRLALAWRRTGRITKEAHDVVPLPAPVKDAVKECIEKIGAGQADILFSDQIAVPLTIGYRAPVIILPIAMIDETDRDVLLTAIGHELVHIRRGDYAFNLLFELFWLPVSFHPAALFIKRRVAALRELCCDETVAARLLKAEVYARSLVTIAGAAPGPGRLVPTTTVGITGAGNLEVRIMSLLKRSEIGSYKKGFLIAAAILLLAVPCLTAVYFVPTVDIESAAQPVYSGVKTAPTPPAGEAAAADERRTALERAVKEIDDSALSREEKEARIERLKKEFAASESVKSDAVRDKKGMVEKVVQAAKELQENARSMGPDELAARKEQLEIEMKMLNGGGGPGPDEARRKFELDRERKIEIEKMAAEARVSMQQAIQTALAQQPGTPTEKRIGRDKNGEVVYKIMVRDAGGSDSLIVVSGMDGRVIKTEKMQ